MTSCRVVGECIVSIVLLELVHLRSGVCVGSESVATDSLSESEVSNEKNSVWASEKFTSSVIGQLFHFGSRMTRDRRQISSITKFFF